jgi:hypothetical protein
MSVSENKLRLQLLLLPECRSEQQLKLVAEATKKLGLQVSGIGRATISATVSATKLSALLERDASSPDSLLVPASLKEWVSSISIASRHQYF